MTNKEFQKLKIMFKESGISNQSDFKYKMILIDNNNEKHFINFRPNSVEFINDDKKIMMNVHIEYFDFEKKKIIKERKIYNMRKYSKLLFNI